jgi:hypothetical protein
MPDYHCSSLKFAYSVFQNGKQMVQEGALTALASVADSSQVFIETLCFIIYNFISLNYSFYTIIFFRNTFRNTMTLSYRT